MVGGNLQDGTPLYIARTYYDFNSSTIGYYDADTGSAYRAGACGGGLFQMDILVFL